MGRGGGAGGRSPLPLQLVPYAYMFMMYDQSHPIKGCHMSPPGVSIIIIYPKFRGLERVCFSPLQIYSKKHHGSIL